ncbi:NUDIX domain-containing protein [Spirosoma aerolatum]|uniref:NUDIX domain-containing protein n=1 Tax=Spirosoma aerolatum TaxID=1211326 RepID=UPI0009AE288A|nr:NUDIX domain-containing protein [Spirosoma aerolatum]
MTEVDWPRQEVQKLYGHRIRVRVCGLCREGNQLLMVRHRGLGPTNTFWSPPGGGIQFSERAPDALVREFREETGLAVDIGGMLFVSEFVQPPLHALELFFAVKIKSGDLKLGYDPEMSQDNQLIEEVKWMHFDDIKRYPVQEVHHVFQHCQSLDEMFQLRGYVP